MAGRFLHALLLVAACLAGASTVYAIAGSAYANSDRPIFRNAYRLHSGPVNREMQTTGWKTYRNKREHFTIKYPAAWSAQESRAADASMSVSFAPQAGDPGVQVTVRKSLPDDIVAPDMLNVYCRQIKIRRLTATQCIDTIARTEETRVVHRGLTYEITSDGKGVAAGTYAAMTKSFRLTR